MDDVYDVIGVGLGPSNLGLAIAVQEVSQAADIDSRQLYLEGRDEFAWHPGMLLPGAKLQVSFLKDLATQRNPNSQYSFLTYLHERNRLADFINRNEFTPGRNEYTDYLRWAVDKINQAHQGELVRYRKRVTSIGFDGTHFRVESGDGILLARNISMGTGILSRIPDFATASIRQFHNHELLDNLQRFDAGCAAPQRIAVVGGGQSAAEVVRYLYGRYPATTVSAFIGKYGYTPADASPYANRIFDTAAVDQYYHAPQETKDWLMREHRYTNYSAPDIDIIKELYDLEYDELVAHGHGGGRLDIRRATRAVGADESDTVVALTYRDLLADKQGTEDFDLVVYATGFATLAPTKLLDYDARQHFTDTVNSNYSLARTADSDTSANIFVNGGFAEHSHGVTGTLLSNIALRSGEIAECIVKSHATLSS